MLELCRNEVSVKTPSGSHQTVDNVSSAWRGEVPLLFRIVVAYFAKTQCVGRSQNITGPYVDRGAMNLLKGGGTLFLGSSGHFICPGRVGLPMVSAINWFNYRYYDAQSNGR